MKTPSWVRRMFWQHVVGSRPDRIACNFSIIYTPFIITFWPRAKNTLPNTRQDEALLPARRWISSCFISIYIYIYIQEPLVLQTSFYSTLMRSGMSLRFFRCCVFEFNRLSYRLLTLIVLCCFGLLNIIAVLAVILSY